MDEGQAAAVGAAEAQLNPPPAYTDAAFPEKTPLGQTPVQAGQFPQAAQLPQAARLQQAVQLQQAAQPIQYVVQGIPPVSAYPRPSYPPPHNYIALAVIVTVICCLLNLTSLAIGIPAIVMGVMSASSASDNKWNSAKKFGNSALYLSIGNMVYTLTLAVVILGVSMGLAYRGCDYIYNYDDGKYRYNCYFEDD